MAPLWRMYAGLGIDPSTGANDAALANAVAIQRRRRILLDAVQTGQVKPQQLSTADSSLLGLPDVHASGGGGALKGIGSFFSNLLGERGLWGVASHLPAGIYGSVKGAIEDTAHGRGIYGEPGQTEKSNKLLHTTARGFKEDALALSELAQGRPQRFIEAPLNPLLDVGSVVSGGGTLLGKAGGSLARSQALRVGELGVTGSGALGNFGQKLSRITSPEGRSPTITGLPRYYSTSPTRKLGQVAWDRFTFGPVGRRLKIPHHQEEKALNRLIDVESGAKSQVAAHTIDKYSRPIVHAFNAMSDPERQATIFSWRGINSPQLVDEFRQQLQTSLQKAHNARMGEDVTGPHIGDFEGDLVKPAAAEVQLKYLEDPNVVQLLSQPTEAMYAADRAWNDYVTGRHSALGIDPELHQEHVTALQSHLLEGVDEPHISSGALLPTYFPERAARGFDYQRPNRLNPLGETYFGRDRLDKTTMRGRLRPDEPLKNPIRPYMHESTLDTALSGASRMDPKVLVEHVKQVENDLLTSSFNQSMLERLGFKGEQGVQSFPDQLEMNRVLARKMNEAKTWGDPNWQQWDPRNWVLIHPDTAIRWFQQRHNAADEVIRILRDNPDAASVEHLLSNRAEQFWKTEVGAAKNSGYAIPRQAYDRIKANMEVNRPYASKWVNGYARGLNAWRTATLAWMPRWLVNTAVGSTVLALIKGNVNPAHYIQGIRLAREDLLPARVRLGGVIHGESLEPGRGVSGVRFPLTKASFRTVQSVEDFFRTSGFVQSLEKAAKQRMAETGTIIDGYRPFFKQADHNAYIDNLIQNYPDLVNKAIEDVDKFAYNFTSLSPNERRYVRLFVPFWGWYKFITKFTYRLPVEFPVRTRAMSAVSEVGKAIEEEVGPMPDWVKGSIILGKDKDGVIKYVPTFGLNPLSQFANPLSPEGKVAGVFRLGQLSPPIQATLAGLGVNSLDAGEVPIGPQEGIGADFLGRLTNASTGESTTAGAHGGIRRGLHALLTSIPQIRIAELAKTGGRPVYPESIPFIDERPMPVQEVSRRNVTPLGIVNQYFGAQPRQYDLSKYQEQLPKRAKYARSRLKREKRLIRSRE